MNPQTADQQHHRQNILVVSRRWCTLSLDQQASWRVLAANTSFVTDTGKRVRLNCYQLFVSLNIRTRRSRACPSSTSRPQSLFSARPRWWSWRLPTRRQVHAATPRGWLPEHLILVQGARPVRSGVRLVQHFPLLGLLPPPVDGWSDITELYVARYGVPKPNQTVWIRTCQHIDGFIDVPKCFASASRPQPRRDAPATSGEVPGPGPGAERLETRDAFKIPMSQFT